MTENQPDNIVIQRKGRSLTLRVQGDADIYSASRLHQLSLELLDDEGDVEVECHQVDQIDTAALQILLALKHALQAAGRNFRVTDASAQFRETLSLAGLTDSIPVELAAHGE